MVPLLKHTYKYDLATDIASVNNKVSVGLFCFQSDLFLNNQQVDLSRGGGGATCHPVIQRAVNLTFFQKLKKKSIFFSFSAPCKFKEISSGLILAKRPKES